MGKNYYCEYCDKRFKDDPSIRKKHMDGLPHQKARSEHYANFKSPREILEDEQKKRPCGKFSSGNCQFGATCRFSHYTPAQLAKIQERVRHDTQQQIESQQPKNYSKSLIEDFVKRRKLRQDQSEKRFLKELFKYPDQLMKIQDELPPSLKLIDPKILKKDVHSTFFG